MTTTVDKSAFTTLVERHRRELRVHCYRMLGSFEESEDMVQETFLRAWRKREDFEARATFRAWLYKIATNACLDALARRPRRVRPGAEVPWLQPFPDEQLEAAGPSEEEPENVVVSRETIELAFLVAIQHLPPRQRATLIARDVLGWSAAETAGMLETSVASINSALQRARAGLRRHLPERRLEWAPGADASEQERELLRRYMEANESGDAAAVAAVLHEDLRFSMPPQPGLYEGRDRIVDLWVEGGFGSASFGEFRCLPTRANLQPAVACYLRRPGEEAFRAMAMDVLRIEEGLVAEIVAFEGSLFPAFNLPQTL
jgi:RNA polymerase sigma-70 factor (ECF subfamily)